jgi:type IV pilus assembly protein PilQ
VEFLDTDIPEQLLRNYDVTDFATPVNSVEVNTSERGTALTLKTTGDFDYLAYQTDNEYVVSIKPLTGARRRNASASSPTSVSGSR